MIDEAVRLKVVPERFLPYWRTQRDDEEALLCYTLLHLSAPPLIYGLHTNTHLRHTGFMGHFICQSEQGHW